MHSCIHAFMHSCIHAFIHSWIHEFIHSSIHPFIIYLFIHSSIYASLFRLVNTKCMGLVDQWKKMSHSNLVTLRQVRQDLSQGQGRFTSDTRSFFGVRPYFISGKWINISFLCIFLPIPSVQVFTSKSFGDHSMIFVYDYFPGADTLMSR